MKRMYLVTREFSYENNEKSFKLVDGCPEVFSTKKNAKKYIEHYTKNSEIISEEKDCLRFAYRTTVHTDLNTYIRWSILGRNLNADY